MGKLLRILAEWLTGALTRFGASACAQKKMAACPVLRACSQGSVNTRVALRAGWFVAIMFWPWMAVAHVPAGTVISNTASASFQITGIPVTIPSDTAELTIAQTDAALSLYVYDPDASAGSQITASATQCQGAELPDPTYVDGSPLNANSAPVNVDVANYLMPGEPLFFVLEDYDQNLDATLREYIDVTVSATPDGDTEIISLAETDVDTGVFAGYLPTQLGGPVAQDCVLSVPYDSNIQVMYEDQLYGSSPVILDIVSIAPNQMTLVKTTPQAETGLGEHVSYSLELTNEQAGETATNVTIIDHLPVGLRYVSGTTRLNGAKSEDPELSADGRELRFSVGDLAPDASLELAYVTKVGVNAPEGQLVNQASAIDESGVYSNVAFASVDVKREEIWQKARVLGQVVSTACDADVQEGDGIPGVRLLMEDGRYAVSDHQGMFHFEGLMPGTHVVKLDESSLPSHMELHACEETTRIAGSQDSRFVELMAGGIDRLRFYLKEKPPLESEVDLEMDGMLKFGKGYFSVVFGSDTLDYQNLRLTLVLPQGVSIVEDSLALNGDSMVLPERRFDTHTLRLGDRGGDWSDRVTYKTDFGPMDSGLHQVQALLTLDTATQKNLRVPVATTRLKYEDVETEAQCYLFRPQFQSAHAEVSPDDVVEMDRIVAELSGKRIVNLEVIGHSDSMPLSARSRKIYGDNKGLSEARAQTVANYFKQQLGLANDQISVFGMGSLRPIATNTTAEGRAKNRRVEVRVNTIQLSRDAHLCIQSQASEQSLWVSQSVKERVESINVPVYEAPKAPLIDARWVNRQNPELAWVWPEENANLPFPNTTLMVKFRSDERVRLLLNGHEVSGLNVDGTVRGQQASVRVWKGVDLQVGDNRFVAISEKSGVETARIERVIHYAGPPVRAELLPELSTLVADGRTPIVVALKLLDRFGKPARPGMMGEYSIESGHIAKSRYEELQATVLDEVDHRGIVYEVVDDGVAYIVLQPTVQSGPVQLRLDLAGSDDQVVSAWVKAQPRDWILVGLAEGQMGYNEIAGNMESLPDVEDEYYDDGRLAFYAKGQVRGEWLLTVAYDSAKEAPSERDRLFEQINPDDYYTLYGDASQQQFDAQSSEKLYLRLEREQFFALFGDFQTGLNVTELARYQRSLTGLQGVYEGTLMSVNAFAAETAQFKRRDEFQGEGISGPYALSSTDMLLNSETVVLETRDRFTGKLLSSETQTRYLDYSIDVNEGSITFKTPIMSRDENLNPIFIVVDYEVIGAAEKAWNYGGRAAVTLDEVAQGLEVGVSQIHEDGDDGVGDLTAVDATLQISEGTELKVEAAQSRSELNGAGDGYLLQLRHEEEAYAARVWVRHQDPEFGLSQQSVTEQGRQSVGADATYRINQEVRVNAKATHEEDLASGSQRDNLKVETEWTRGALTAKGGMRYVEERSTTGAADSTLVTGGTRYNLGRYKTILRADAELAVDGDVDQYPDRLTLGADYQLSNRATLYAEQEWAENDEYAAQVTSVGLRSTPWQKAQMQTAVGERSDELGVRTFATMGLIQNVSLNDHSNLSFGVDHSQSNDDQVTNGASPGLPLSIGDVDNFTAVHVGYSYSADRWALSSRLENRDGETADQRNVFFGVYREQARGLGLAASLHWLYGEQSGGSYTELGELNLSLAWRPQGGDTVILDKLSFINDDYLGNDERQLKEKVINSLNLHHRLTRDDRLSFIQGTKWVNETVADEQLQSSIWLFGGEWRHDVTARWDVGVKASTLMDSDTGSQLYSLGFSVGTHLQRQVWASLGYNVYGYDDEDFSAAHALSQGVYLKLRWAFDKQSVKDLAAAWAP